jgi:hypothetical protein
MSPDCTDIVHIQHVTKSRFIFGTFWNFLGGEYGGNMCS